METAAIFEGREGETRKVWEAWCDLGAELLRNLVLMHDPDVIVLGGGLGALPEVACALEAGLRARAIGGFPMPPVVQAEGGPTAGGRGAAYAAVGEVVR
jgi:N-acetylglucosamine kinase